MTFVTCFGRIGRARFQSVVHDPANTLCFVCGPRAMVNESVSTLAGLGVPADAIRTEAWSVPRVMTRGDGHLIGGS